MKRILYAAIIAIFFPMMTNAQTYSALWRQANEASDNDLPQTEQEVLTKIVEKATQEKAYGQLLKAELQHARSQCEVSSDSLAPSVERLKQRAEEMAGDTVLQAVYYAVLGYLYTENPRLDSDRHATIGRQYYDMALAHPTLLAKTKANIYEPFVIKGQDSRYYNDDLLSIVATLAGRYDIMRDHYLAAGNRRATLFASLGLLRQQKPSDFEPLNKSLHIQRIDSLIAEYGDLEECGEAAIDRYKYMDDNTNASPEQKWQYINQALERWGAWQRMNVLRNAQRTLTCPGFFASTEHKVTIPQVPVKMELSNLRSISELTVRLYSVKAEGDTDIEPGYEEGYKRIKPLLTALPDLTMTRKYVGKAPYEVYFDSITLPHLPVGVYMAEIETQPATSTARQLFFVSDVRLLVEALPATGGAENGRLRIVAVNATTGQPLPGATVKVTTGYGRDKKTKTLKCDDNGECTYNKSKNDYRMELFASTSADKACPAMDSRGSFYYNNRSLYDETTEIFTDRAIYRPGQTVHVAAVTYNTTDGRTHKVVGGRKMTIMLRDANWKVISDKSVVTDDFGTCTAQFTLPTRGLTGNFTVSVNGHSHSIRVEEYKRPTFEVDIPRVSESYEDGDTVVAKGNVRSYSGVPVQGAAVKYKVVRRRAFWWMSYSRYWSTAYIGTGSDDVEVASGETTTDDKGVFSVDVPMVLPKTKYTMFYNFVLTADVTDLGGETHQGTMSLPLGTKKTAFSVTMPEKVLAEAHSRIAFHQQNAAGVDLEAKVRYRFDNGRWQEAKTNQLVDIPQLKSGLHTLHAICSSDTLDQDFVVFSLDDTRPAVDTRSWFYTSHENFPMDGGPVTVHAGSSDKDVYVVYTVISGDKVLESGSQKLSNELINRKLTYSEEKYGNGVLLTFAWMKGGEAYKHSTTICRPMPEMHLDMKWTTFRNKLTPGQKEEWTLAVTKADGTPADAQLMATLYDKSLDQLQQHNWTLVPSRHVPLPSTDWESAFWDAMTLSGKKYNQWLTVHDLSFSHFDTDVFPTYIMRLNRMNMSSRSLRRKVGRGIEEPMMMAAAVEETVVEREMYDEAATDNLQSKKETNSSGSENDTKAEAQVRTNLQETAFFMPQLVADSTGSVKMRFTMPESLTTWRFLAVAHTRDMMFGNMNDEAVAKKDVMIQPNIPRFLRQNDNGTIAARIINMSDEEIKGTATLQLLDPETEAIVMEQKQQVTLKDSTTTAVIFNIQPINLNSQTSTLNPLLIVRVTIDTPKHSDGEQHYLPILPSMERVTVTVPFTQTAPGTKEINLEELFKVSQSSNLKSQISTLKSQLTVEYTNNPVWLMIQALPAVGHPHDECAVCQATSLYANSIGQHILKQNPTAKHVFEQWKREDQNTQSTLNSQLQKDQELKDLLLDETPWVLDADREEEQRQKLAEFFDPNLIDTSISTALENLRKLQNSNGSWSWWPGMRGSLYMTTAVTEMMVRLNTMTGTQQETKRMLEKAFDYLGDDIVELVKEMKKEERKGVKQYFPTFRALQWLYICALDGRELPKKVSEANEYLKELLKKEVKNQTIYEKALSAVILNNKTYVKSLKEWTVYREDMGRYYDTQRASYSWRDYKIPTQVAAIEAIKALTPQDTTTITEMQRWLLQEKRTQAWDTPLNSADAIYAFLNGNSQALAPQPKTVLTIDNRQIDTSEATAGLGYVKTRRDYNGEKTFKAEKTSTGTSWGAVYAQFMQNTTDIEDHHSGITVKRELFRVKSSEFRDDSSKVSQLSTQNPQLKVGDRVTVRITIDADRDYDFVQVQDKRAACMEPVSQRSGYDWYGGYYVAPKDNNTSYFFDMMPKGRHIIETEYYIDREGTYQTGTCTAQCAYSPEFRSTTKAMTIEVTNK